MAPSPVNTLISTFSDPEDIEKEEQGAAEKGITKMKFQGERIVQFIVA